MVVTGNRLVVPHRPTAMRRTLMLLALPALALGGVACSDDDSVDTGASPVGDGDPSDVVISISSGGGFVPFGVDFAAVPTVVQRDGTVLTGGAVIAIYPGPALSPVSTGTLSGDALAELLEAAEEAGLESDALDFGEPGVSDSPTTTITVEIDGGTYTHEAYALGFGEDMGGDLGLSEEQLDLRAAVQDFVGEVSDAVTTAATDTYEPTAYQVLALPVDPADLAGSEPAPNELAWPLADVALAEGACIDITGDDATAFAALLPDATQITIWRDAAGATWQLATRAVLPGDDPC
jgi:hypothetical protein